jgi:hypothetical protein
VAVLFHRYQIPSLGGGWLLRPSTTSGGASSRRMAVRRLRHRLGALGTAVDLIVVLSGGLGCFSHFSGFPCFFVFLWGPDCKVQSLLFYVSDPPQKKSYIKCPFNFEK